MAKRAHSRRIHPHWIGANLMRQIASGANQASARKDLNVAAAREWILWAVGNLGTVRWLQVSEDITGPIVIDFIQRLKSEVEGKLIFIFADFPIRSREQLNTWLEDQSRFEVLYAPVRIQAK